MLDFIKIFIMVSVTVLCLATQSFASTLDNVEIKPKGNTFDIVLNSKDKISSKTVIKNDEMVLTLKNTKPSTNFYTKYDTHNIDNLIVKTDKNNTKIIIKSKNLPTPTNNNKHYYWLLGLSVFCLFSRRKSAEENFEFKAKVIPTQNIDYILEHKIKNKNDNKIKIAA